MYKALGDVMIKIDIIFLIIIFLILIVNIVIITTITIMTEEKKNKLVVDSNVCSLGHDPRLLPPLLMITHLGAVLSSSIFILIKRKYDRCVALSLTK